jgi:ribosomal protein L18
MGANAGTAITEGPRRSSGGGNGGNNGGRGQQPESAPFVTQSSLLVQQQTVRLAEIMAAIKANQVKKELSEIQVKVEFQALILQLFMQRRYEHVLIATRFYRALFNDGDSKLNLGKDAKDLFERSTGSPPTVGVLDSLANEALRDTREGVKAFLFLVEKEELDSASKRLGEAFVIGEYVPEIRTLPRTKKRLVVDYSRKSYQLLSALDVKDYTLAQTLVDDLSKVAKDFDASKPLAAIETARTVANLHLQKARNAALSGDKTTLETELAAATELWPRNPALAEMSQRIFNQGDVVAQTITDFDQLHQAKNFRRIYDERMRFAAAMAMYADRRVLFEKVMADMQQIETAILRAQEMARQNNAAGAWESVERAYASFPEDSKLNALRANLTIRAAEFVQTIQGASELEAKDQIGSSLAGYLKARRLYPASDIAMEGIERLAKSILSEPQ